MTIPPAARSARPLRAPRPVAAVAGTGPPRRAAPAVGLALTLAALALAGCGGRADGRPGTAGDPGTAAAPRAGPAPPGGPVVVELFTSQGCSSCPPADRLLSRLAADPGRDGLVIPLAFHVDYWDHIGWRDPFGSPRWSARQRAYARRLDAGVYTPQVVVGGRFETVGSRAGAVEALIDRALATPPAGRVELSGEADGPVAVRLRVRASLDRATGGGPVEALVAVVEDGLRTPVERGENARRTLANDRVVRRLERALTLPGEAGVSAAAELTVRLDPAWERRWLGVAAFLQDPESLAVHGAAWLPLGERSEDRPESP